MQKNPWKTHYVIVDKTFSNGARRFLVVSDGGYEGRIEWWTSDMFTTALEARNACNQRGYPNAPVLAASEFERLSGLQGVRNV